EADEIAFEVLLRDCQHPLDHAGMSGFGRSDVPEEGADSGEARITATYAVAPFSLEVIEERADQRCVQKFERQLAGRLAEMRLSEAHQQPERVAVSRDGVRPRLSLTQEPIRKERLEQRREGGHGSSPPARSSRSAAGSSSSRAAVRYQYVWEGQTWPRY